MKIKWTDYGSGIWVPTHFPDSWPKTIRDPKFGQELTIEGFHPGCGVYSNGKLRFIVSKQNLATYGFFV